MCHVRKIRYNLSPPYIIYIYTRWNFVIHGSIDGYSRFIPMLRVSINNLAKTALDFFFESIKSCGIPGRVRGDGGSEFNHVEAFMELANGESRGSFLRGKSVHNQRIERLWRDVHEKVVEKYQKTFYHMENVREHLNTSCIIVL